MKKILVLGATGFTGKLLSQDLLKQGHAVRCMVRTPAKAQGLAAAGCEIVQGDVADAASLVKAAEGVDAAYNLVHTLSPQTGPGDFVEVEIRGLENIVQACRAHGVRRLLYLTSLGISENSPSMWCRGRFRAEQFFLGAGLDVTILRPGQIVGRGGQGFEMTLGNAKRRIATVMGSRTKQSSSIAVDDLVCYLVAALEEPRTFGQCFEVGNDDVLTSDQMIDAAAAVLGRAPPRKLHLSPRLLKPFAGLLERVAKLPSGAVSDFVQVMSMDLVGDPTPIRKILPKPLMDYRQAVQRALS